MPTGEVLRALIRDVPDWPTPGVGFKDITPLLADPVAFDATIADLSGRFTGQGITKVLGIEARGFVIAAPVALRLGAGFVPARKPGKLPWHTTTEEYQLEYGTDTIEIHDDAIATGEQVLIIDDVIATGGTAVAAIRLVESVGGVVAGLGFVLELAFLGGAARLSAEHVSLVTFE